jgi:Helicase conserved C-terminal domain
MEMVISRFDTLLSKLRLDQLRSIAEVWVVGKPGRKDELVHAIARAYADPARVRLVLSALSPEERALLALLRRAGGGHDVDTLLMLLRAAGFAVASYSVYEPNQPLLVQMIAKGLLLTSNRHNPGELQSYYANMVFTDERIFAELPDLEPAPLAIEPVAAPPVRKVRRARAVTLDLLALTQAIEGMGGLQINKNGTVRQGDLRRLAKALGWGEANGQFDGAPFRSPVHALIEALGVIQTLVLRGDRLVLNGGARFATMPIGDLVGRLLDGYLNLPSWTETEPPYMDAHMAYHYMIMRASLLMLLDSLPPAEEGFFAIEQISAQLFERVGRSYSLTGPISQPTPYARRGRGAASDPQPQVVSDWEVRTLKRWQSYEAHWIAQALTSWFFFLGLVELGIEGIAIRSVRLTDLGHHVIHPSRAPRPLEAPSASGPAWMVQPDFEVMVYLEQASPAQLALIEQIGERVQTQAHIARYRLTRDSVYRALERGVSVDIMLAELASGSGMPLPQNVAASAREWAGLRDRMTLRRRASLIEYPTAEARDAALSAGVLGRPIGARLVLLDPGAPPRAGAGLTILDYTLPPPRALSVTDDGVVQVTRGATDLLAPHLLNRWAERDGDGRWRFTAASVRAAAGRGGAGVAGLIDQLSARLTHPIPDLLPFTLRAWAGERTPAQLGEVVTLQLENPDLAEALGESHRFAPLLARRLGRTTFLVRASDVGALRALLAEIGIAAEPPAAP